MSYRIRNDIEQNTKEVLIARYITPFKSMIEKTGDFDNWLDIFLIYCAVSALSEDRRPKLNDIYELNVKPLSIKTDNGITFDDLVDSYNRLVARGYFKGTGTKIEPKIESPHVSEKAVDRAFEELLRAGLAERHPIEKEAISLNRGFNDLRTKMYETITDYIMEQGNEIIKSQIFESKSTYIFSNEVAKSILERFVKKYEIQLDKRILMGILGGSAKELMSSAPLYLKQLKKELNYEDSVQTIITTSLLATLAVYAETKITSIIDVKNMFENQTKMLKELRKIKITNLEGKKMDLEMIRSISMQFEQD